MEYLMMTCTLKNRALLVGAAVRELSAGIVVLYVIKFTLAKRMTLMV
jgi:hypothetical protein